MNEQILVIANNIIMTIGQKEVRSKEESIAYNQALRTVNAIMLMTEINAMDLNRESNGGCK